MIIIIVNFFSYNYQRLYTLYNLVLVHVVVLRKIALILCLDDTIREHESKYITRVPLKL